MSRLFCNVGMLNFTRFMFHAIAKTKYIIGNHHRQICEALDNVLSGKCNRLIINIAPRYGKTELVSKMFIAYGFSKNPSSKFIHLSYSKDLVLDNSTAVRTICSHPKYIQMYPEVQIVGRASGRWKTSEGGQMYAVSSGGQVTGFGAGAVDEDNEIDEEGFADGSASRFAGAIVIDDPMKPEDALSDSVRTAINERFENTIRSRANSRNTPIVIIMQRLHEDDLCGYLLRNEPDTWTVLHLPCLTIDENGEEKALWPFKHTVEELHHLASVNPYVFETQYQQNPQPREGLMYESFKEYDVLPIEKHRIKAYVDTADTGGDYLCAIIYAEYTFGCYVLDVLYTKKSMEYTEVETAQRLTKYSVQSCMVESNNGGRSFRRNVEKNVREMGNRITAFIDFTQTNNKQVRIFTKSNEVRNFIFFPRGWDMLYPEYAKAMRSYRKEGRNAHDDAPDATTGIIEHLDAKQAVRISRT